MFVHEVCGGIAERKVEAGNTVMFCTKCDRAVQWKNVHCTHEHISVLTYNIGLGSQMTEKKCEDCFEVIV